MKLKIKKENDLKYLKTYSMLIDFTVKYFYLFCYNLSITSCPT